MLQRVEAETAEFEQCTVRLQALRLVHSRMLKDALLGISSDRLREEVGQMQAEMKAWENYALKRLGKPGGREFEPRAIDVLTAMRIKGALARAKSAPDVRAVFALERGGERLIERAVSALERYGHRG